MASVIKRKWTYKGEIKSAWTVRYFDDDGVRRSKNFDLKKTADAFLRTVQREIEDGTHTPDTEALTYPDAVDLYLRHADRRRVAGDIGNVRLNALTAVLTRRVLPLLGTIRLKDITAERVEELHLQLIVERKVSRPTARKTILELVLFEKWAKRHKYLKNTPFADAYAMLPPAPKPPIKQFTKDDIANILIAAETHRYKAKAYSTEMISCFVSMAALCGMRIGEILGLTIENVDFEQQIIRVRHSLSTLGELKGPKTASGVRDLHMPVHVEKVLRRWVETRYINNPQRLVFRSHKGQRLERMSIHRTWKNLLRQSGLDPKSAAYRFHNLRHFFASNIVDQDVRHVPALSRSLGHASIDTTMRVYVHGMRAEGLPSALVSGTASNILAMADARVTQQPLNH